MVQYIWHLDGCPRCDSVTTVAATYWEAIASLKPQDKSDVEFFTFDITQTEVTP